MLSVSATRARSDLAMLSTDELEDALATLASHPSAGGARGGAAKAEGEAELIELASALTAAQLERAVRAYRRVSTEEARDLHEDAHLSASWDGDGSLARPRR